MADSSALAALEAENARLIALLDAHGIEWRLPPSSAVRADREPEPAKLSTAEKIGCVVSFGFFHSNQCFTGSKS